MAQSIQAMTPSMIGEPFGDGSHLTLLNRSSSTSRANDQHSSPWSAPRMLTQNRPVGAIFCQLIDSAVGRKPTFGGSSDTDVNEPIVMPNGWPSSASPVTTVTPVGKCPSTWRNRAESKLATAGDLRRAGRRASGLPTIDVVTVADPTTDHPVERTPGGAILMDGNRLRDETVAR